MNKVSVIIPVYNVEKYLTRCVESVINQTYKNIEIVLVDDGSTDDSLKICNQISKKDSRVKVYHKENGGSGSARNYGLNKSSGEYILFIDSDDYIENDTVEKMIEHKDYDIVYCGFDRVDENTKKVYSKEMIKMPFDELEINDDTILETAFLSPSVWGKLYKRQLIENIKFSEDKDSIEDVLFYSEVMKDTTNIKFIKEVLWHYTVRKDSLISKVTESKADLFEKDLLEIKNEYIANNYSKARLDFLTLTVIIHNCISIPTKLYDKKINMGKRLIHIKKYMNDNFQNWDKIKIKVKGRYIKKLLIHKIILMYKMNTFYLFLVAYNYAITKLRLNTRW